MKHLFALAVLLFAAFVSQAQELSCSFDLSSVQAQLAHAQETADGGDLGGALAELALAKANLKLIETGCTGAAAEGVGERTNPVPLGQWQDFENLGKPLGAARVTGYVDDAAGLVLAADSNNRPPADGMRYVLIEYELRCNKSVDESCEFSSSTAKAVGSRGLLYEANYISLAGILSRQEFFAGATVAYKTVLEVGADETDILFIPGYGDRTYFSTQ